MINTRSNLLLYNFESVEWSYNSPAEKMSDFIKQNSSSADHHRLANHAFDRAKTLRRKGSGWLQEQNASINNAENSTADNKRYQRRVRSAPVRPPTSSIQRHVMRVQSAVTGKVDLMVRSVEKPRTQSRKLTNNSKPDSDEKIEKEIGNLGSLLTREKSAVRKFEKETTPNSNVPRVMARSRSAPAHRTRTLPLDERGFTSSSNIAVKILDNKLCPSGKKQQSKTRPFSATAPLKNPTDVYCNLKLKSFYQQLDYEAELTQKKI